MLTAGLLVALSTAPAAAAAATAAQPTAATAAATAATGTRYVALGDSYAAGLGITPAATGAPASGCGQSARDYPHQVAAALGLALTDVTCSGAVTADLTGSQRPGGTGVAPQLDALRADTALVTLTIGGNDLGFGSIAAYCASAAGPDGPVLGGSQTCRDHYDPGGADSLQAKLDGTVVPAITSVLGAVRARAPQAKVVVVDYPAIAPDAANTPSGGCWTDPLRSSNALPFTTTDLPYLQQTQARLNDALDRAATAAGAAVAQVYPASLAHTACASDPWVNGVQVLGLSITASSLHPNLSGATQMARTATAAARTVLAGGTVAAPRTVADPPATGPSGAVIAAIVVGVLVVAVAGLGALRVRRRNRA